MRKMKHIEEEYNISLQTQMLPQPDQNKPNQTYHKSHKIN